MQKRVGYFFMRVLDHIHAERLVFCGNTSEHCDVVVTTRSQGLEDIRWAISAGLEHDWSLFELCANDISVVGGSSGNNGGAKSSGVAS